MNVVTLNASPNTGQGHTWQLLDPLMEAMTDEGARVNLHHIRGMDIEPCRGCMTCWQTGECVIDDDMDSLLAEIGSCDLLLLGMPLYVDAMPGPLKTVCDRMLPLVSPEIVLVDGHCRHPAAEGVTGPERICLVSVCGFYERDNFDTLIDWTGAVCRNLGVKLAGAIVRPHVHALDAMPDEAPPKQDLEDNLQRAGEMLAHGQRVPAGLQDAIAAPLCSLQAYLRFADSATQ